MFLILFDRNMPNSPRSINVDSARDLALRCALSREVVCAAQTVCEGPTHSGDYCFDYVCADESDDLRVLPLPQEALIVELDLSATVCA